MIATSLPQTGIPSSFKAREANGTVQPAQGFSQQQARPFTLDPSLTQHTGLAASLSETSAETVSDITPQSPAEPAVVVDSAVPSLAPLLSQETPPPPSAQPVVGWMGRAAQENTVATVSPPSSMQRAGPAVSHPTPIQQSGAVTVDMANPQPQVSIGQTAQIALPMSMVSTPAQHGADLAPTAQVNAQPAEWAPVRVDTRQGKWGEQMMQVLQDRVTLQAQQNMQEARIRLDPPDLGKLDVLVRVEGDRLSVQINANAVATREALIQVSERLRAELQNQHFVHVDVNVGDGEAGRGRQSTGSDDDMHVFAARDVADEHTPAHTHTEHWLSTQA